MQKEDPIHGYSKEKWSFEEEGRPQERPCLISIYQLIFECVELGYD